MNYPYFKIIRFTKIVFWPLLILAILGIAAASFYTYQYLKSSSVLLSLKAPSEVLAGIPFKIDAKFENNSQKILSKIRLSLDLPESAISPEEGDKRVISRDFPDLAPGSSLNAEFPVFVLNKGASIKRFQVSVFYSTEAAGLNTTFKEYKTLDISTVDPAIKLDLNVPEKVLSSENFEIKVDYKNISDFKFQEAELDVELPASFKIKKTDPSPQSGTTWILKDLDKDEGGAVKILGSIIAPDNSFFEVRSSVKTSVGIIDEKTASINIAPSPLSINVSLNNAANYITRAGDALRYVIHYKNSSDTDLSDVIVKAKLTGEMFDFNTTVSNGYFASKDNTLTWNPANTSEFRLLSPGAEGNLTFEIRTKTSYPIRRLSDKNFALKVSVEISSPTVPYYVSADKTAAVTNLETKVAGAVEVETKVFFKDPSGIINTGPLPPQVNKSTTFTVHWLLKSFAVDLKNIEARATLLPGVKFLKAVKNDIGSEIIYNERGNGIVLKVESLPANKGVISSPVEIIFQIEAVPSSNQVGQIMPLVSETKTSATDTFTNTELFNSSPVKTTQVDDIGSGIGQGTVIP